MLALALLRYLQALGITFVSRSRQLYRGQMIYESLIAPHENLASLRDIMRAMLTYDKVKIIDPNDRDVMPSNAFISLIMGVGLFGLAVGPIRPMGKTIGYDDSFQKILDTSNPAIQQDLFEVVSTYKNLSQIPCYDCLSGET